jgi:hypothetical protein
MNDDKAVDDNNTGKMTTQIEFEIQNIQFCFRQKYLRLLVGKPDENIEFTRPQTRLYL